MGYSVFHMFAGAGGGILADLLLGHRTVGAIEIEAYPRQVLIDRQLDGSLPQFPIWDDVRTFSYENADTRSYIDWLRERRDSLVIAAGFPCQDLSVAGKQSGLGEGTRSGLYREVIRIAGVIRPRFLFLENVAAILSGGLEHVLADLAALGYDCRWTCLRASDVGAPHHRDRWWLRAVRNADNDGQPSAEISRSITSGSDDYKTREKQASKLTGSGEQFPHVADTVRTRLQGHREITGGIEQEHHDTGHDSWWSVESDVCGMADELAAELHQIEPHSCEQDASARRPAHGSWWGKEPDVGRVTTDKLANRTHRIKALGNGQVPLQAAVAWRMLGGE